MPFLSSSEKTVCAIKKKMSSGGSKTKSNGRKRNRSRTEAKTVPDVLRIKITSIGDGGVGKSCLIKRYCEEKFVSKYISTIGVDFGVKPIQIHGFEVKVNFWDLSGHPEFFEVRNEFYKDTQGALLVYDCSSRRSFEALDGWLEEAARFGVKENTVFAVVGTKCDKTAVVDPNEGANWAEERGFIFFEASAKTGRNVNEIFEYLFTTAVERSPAFKG